MSSENIRQFIRAPYSVKTAFPHGYSPRVDFLTVTMILLVQFPKLMKNESFYYGSLGIKPKRNVQSLSRCLARAGGDGLAAYRTDIFYAAHN